MAMFKSDLFDTDPTLIDDCGRVTVTTLQLESYSSQ